MIDAPPNGRAYPRRPIPMAISQRDAMIDAAVDLFASTWKQRAEGLYPTYSEFRRAVVFSIARQLSTSLAAAATLYNFASRETRAKSGLVTAAIPVHDYED